MYTYVKSSCLVRSMGYRWADLDLKDKSLSYAYGKSLKLYLTVHDDVTDSEIYVDMEVYRSQLATLTMTVQEWLDKMDGKPLVAIAVLPDSDLATAVYMNAILAGYKIEPVLAGYNHPPEMPITELTDLKITRPNTLTDVSILHSHCLMSVNGYFHRTDSDGKDAYVIDGGTTARKLSCSHTGILSFLNIGSVEQKSFLDENLIPLNEDGKLKDGVIIDLGEDIIGKSPIFIIGGYIIRPDGLSLVQNSETTWILYPKALPLLERYFNSRNELDLSSLDIEVLDTNPEHSIVLESIYSDSNLKAWFKLSQSFIAVIDTPELYTEEVPVRVSNIPGFITAYQDPLYPLIMGYGKQVEYSKIKEASYWSLRINDPWYKQFTFQKAPIRTQNVVKDSALPWRPYQRTQGYMLKYSAFKKKP